LALKKEELLDRILEGLITGLAMALVSVLTGIPIRKALP